MRTPDDYIRSVHAEPSVSLYRNRAFMLLLGAYGVSAMGDHISEMAVLKSMNALEATNLTQLQAMMTFMFMLPFFVLGPVAGMLADRLPRRGVMIFADLVRMVIMFNFGWLLAWFLRWGAGPDGTISQEHIWGFMPLLIVGIFAAVFSPARLSLMPTLIREDQLVRANAMTGGLGVIASMAAVLIGGYLADHYPPRVAFMVDAGTFLASAILLIMIRPPAAETSRPPATMGLSALGHAGRYIWKHRRVAQLILVAVVVWSGGAVVRSTIPAIVRDVYHRPEYLEISGFQARLGLGMLFGAILLTVLGNALRSESAISLSLSGLTLSIALLAYSAFMKSSDWAYHVGGLAVVLSGTFATGVMASYLALLQRIVPNRLRGRVFGLTDLVSMLGLLLATGLIGMNRWPGIDRWVGGMLVAVAFLMGITAVASWWLRRRMPLAGRKGFWRHMNEFYCKLFFSLHRRGPCRVPAHGPVIVVSNHTCSVDPLLLIASTHHRPISWLVAREYYHWPIVGWIMKKMRCIPVQRNSGDAGATRMALRHLRDGGALGIFIEGGIPAPGQSLEPKDGAALLALHTNALIVPARISGTKYSDSILRPFIMRHKAVVRYGKPIDLSRQWIDKVDKKSLGKITETIMRRIEELGEDADEA